MPKLFTEDGIGVTIMVVPQQLSHVEIKLELTQKEIKRNAESICPQSSLIMFLVVVLVLKFILKLRFPTDVSFLVVLEASYTFGCLVLGCL